MPHRTIFQWGKNTAHPFTVFIGGVIIGALVAGVVVYAWMSNNTNNDSSDFGSTIIHSKNIKKTPSPTVSPSPTASAKVQF